MNDWTFHSKDLVSMTDICQNFRVPCNICNTHEKEAMLQFKRISGVPALSVNRAHVSLPTESA